MVQEGFGEIVRSRRNWGRWGADDQRGTVNLISPEHRTRALQGVREGHVVSLSRPLSRVPSAANPAPVHHYLDTYDEPGTERHAAIDYLAMTIHGQSITHLDALCHMWESEGMWGGRDPGEMLTFKGAGWGGIEAWREGIVTRCVLLDVPGHRGEPFVREGAPVTGAELRAVAQRQGVTLEPGDAVAVYSGREEWDRHHPDRPWGSRADRPGLHVSCFEILAEADTSVLLWDMLDQAPVDGDTPWGVHMAIPSLGLALVDNALLEEAAAACRDRSCWSFLLVVAPLVLPGGTGSPVNPLAIF